MSPADSASRAGDMPEASSDWSSGTFASKTMPLRITLRKDRAQSPFRHLLNTLLTMPSGHSAILCSGYIWQPNNGGYNILDDGLRQAVASGCTTGGLTTIAGKFYPSYYEDYYRNFVTDLRATGVPVTAYYAPKKNWHAKVAIRMAAHRPIAALVGSSNLTGPAYGENRNWNFEADVLIWSTSQAGPTAFSNARTDQEFGIIDVVLNPEIPQPDEDSQLKSIYEDVMSSELEDFE